VHLRDAAIATSGGYRRGFIAHGRRVSHIVDPRTGQPTERIASASVFAPDCATADALSTAFSVLTPQESVALADSLSAVGCLLVERDGTITTNATWNARAIAPHHETSEESTDARYA
jgi:FAD:protein FMN transferase